MIKTMYRTNRVHTLHGAVFDIRLQVTEGDVQLALADRETGHMWGPVPLLRLDIHDATVRRLLHAPRIETECLEVSERAAHLRVRDPTSGIVARIHLAVDADALVVRIPWDDVVEAYPDHCRLFAIEVAPGLAAAHGGEELWLPLGQGCLCRPAGKARLDARFLLYLEQSRWELAPLLPFCAAQSRNGGLMVLPTAGDCDAECRVVLDGHDHGHCGFAATFRRHWPDPVDPIVREFRFLPLRPGDDADHQIAARLRDYVTGVLGKRPLADRAADCPPLAYAMNAYIMKPFLGMQRNGLQGGRPTTHPPEMLNLMTFGEAADALGECKAAGIDKVLAFVTGWNLGGHDGAYPTRFPVERAFGGEEGLRSLLAVGRDLGFHVSAHDNFMMNIPSSPDWDASCVTRDLHGQPLLHGWWCGGLEYQTWGLSLPEARLEGHLERMRRIGFQGMYYCDYMQQPLEVNYDPERPGARRACLDGQVRIWRAARDAFGAVATEFAPFHAAIECDLVSRADTPAIPPHWPERALIDRSAPIWTLAFHGLVLCEELGETWHSVQRAMLLGRCPRAEWSMRPGYAAVFNRDLLARLHAIHELCIRRFGHLRAIPIRTHTARGPQAGETLYADGTRVAADFASGDLFVNDAPIPVPNALADTLQATGSTPETAR